VNLNGKPALGFIAPNLFIWLIPNAISACSQSNLLHPQDRNKSQKIQFILFGEDKVYVK